MMRTLTILVPLDGSAASEQALAVPIALAARTDLRVILARSADRADRQSNSGGAASYLAGHAAALRERGVNAATVVLHGRAATALAEEARRQVADLIVMVRRDHAGLAGWIHRSITEDLLAATPAPLLLLHATSGTPPPAFPPGLRLIVAHDGSHFSDAALPAARRLAEILGAPVRLMRTVSNEAILSAPVIAADGRSVNTLDRGAAMLLAQARGDLVAIGENLGLEPGQVECDVRFGEATDVLLSVEAEHEPTLLVMATHGYSGLQRAALGGVATDLLRRGHRPLLLVRPPEQTGPLTPQRMAEAEARE
jgi:nucleotide-binding universal stress UspA family protein